MIDLSEIPVLVVDDDVTTRSLNIRILRRIGFTNCFEAGDGTEALQVLQTTQVAFVLSDLHMKPMDGLSFLHHLRTSDISILKGLPVIMLTSEMRKEAIAVGEKLGIVAYVVKPTSRLELKAAIEKALGISLDEEL